MTTATMVTWVSNPTIGPSGDQIAYELNRITEEGSYENEIWVMNLLSGEEKIFARNANIVDWKNEQMLIYRVFGQHRDAV